MPTLTINGVEVEVDKGTTLLKAAAVAGFEVPHFCYHPALSAPANCRMCLVEVEGQRKLLPACYNTVADGWVVHTESEEVIKARKAVLEFILVNHPVDCPICDKAGECKLQDYYFAYDAQESRMRAEKQRKVKAYPIGPRVVYDGERCILCTRCIRFCEEITGTNELTLVDRGDKIEVRTFPGMDLDNDYSLCTVDVCPVGALTSRDFRFKCRVWLLTSTESVCTGCAMGCSIHLDHFQNEVQRYRPRNNPQVNEYWMCDEGRMTYKELHDERLLSPMSNGAHVTWRDIGRTLATKMEAATKSGAVAFVVSPQASCEDLHLARLFVDELDADVKLYLGGKPDGSSDDFLIKADKNPNRAGVERVFVGLEQFDSLTTLTGDLEEGGIGAVYMMGSEVDVEGDDAAALTDALGKAELFVLQASRDGGLADLAHIVLPACTHAEKDGTFVNHHGVVQGFREAFKPHGESMPDWQIFMRMAKAMGKKLSFTFLDQIQDEMFKAFEEFEAAAAAAAEASEAEDDDAPVDTDATQEEEASSAPPSE